MRLFICLYKALLSPLFHAAAGASAGCRFYPSCSSYAEAALSRHGLTGVWMSARRILSCHPWSLGGFDPVRDPKESSGVIKGIRIESAHQRYPGELPEMRQNAFPVSNGIDPVR